MLKLQYFVFLGGCGNLHFEYRYFSTLILPITLVIVLGVLYLMYFFDDYVTLSRGFVVMNCESIDLLFLAMRVNCMLLHMQSYDDC